MRGYEGVGLAFVTPARNDSDRVATSGERAANMLQSHNFAPPSDLLPFVRQFFVFHAALPDDFTLIDRLISESAMVRVLLKGDWAGKFGDDGEWRREGPSILFGANSRSFGVRVTGPFTVVGVALRPSGWAGLFDRKASDAVDGMFALGGFWGDVDTLYERLAAAPDDAAVIASIEAVVREQLARIGSYASNAAMATFEDIARTDSTIRVADAAARCGLSGRALERQCCATFGLTPKVILRRSRFLDMAAAVRGISDPDEEERAALRFSDQSHLNREFRHFIGMTPGQFERAQTPLLNAVLKLREDGLS
jgi:AraC-like DNA-binding protein